MTALLLFVIFLHATTGVLNYLIHHDVLYPPVLQSAIWALVLCVYSFSPDFPPLDRTTLLLISAANLAFTLGGYVTTLDVSLSRCNTPAIEQRDLWFLKAVLGIAAIG